MTATRTKEGLRKNLRQISVKLLTTQRQGWLDGVMKEHTPDCPVDREESTEPERGRFSIGSFTVTGYCEHGYIVEQYNDSLM